MRRDFDSLILATFLISASASFAQTPAADDREPRLVVQTGHTSAVFSVAFSADGRCILSGAPDAARLWDIQTGKEMLVLEVNAHAVAYSRDGKLILTGNKAGGQLFDASTGKERFALEGEAQTVAISPDGKFLLTGGVGSLKLWDSKSGQLVRKFDVKRMELVKSTAFSADGQRVIAAVADRVEIWETANGKSKLSMRKAGSPDTVAFTPDGKRFIFGTHVCQTDAGVGLATLKGPGKAFSPNGMRVVSADGTNIVHVYNSRNGNEQLALPGHTKAVTAAAFSPDGSQILTGSKDETVRLWDSRSGKLIRVFKGPGHAEQVVALSPDGGTILNSSNIAPTRLWDARAGNELCTLQGHSGRVTSAAFAPGGLTVVTGSEDKTARLWDARTGKELLVFTGHTDKVTTVAFTPDGKLLLTGSADKSARIWDVQTGKEKIAFKNHTGSVIATAFAPNGKQAFTAEDYKARLWDVETGKEVTVISVEGLIKSVAFGPTTNFLMIARGKLVGKWDLRGQPLANLKQIPFEPKIQGNPAAFSPNGRRVFLGGKLKSASIWNTMANPPVELATLQGHSGTVTSASFSDGKFILTGCEDNLARLYDAATGKEICRLISLPDGWVVVDATGRYDASQGGDVEGLHWVVDMKPIAFNQLKDRYYDPGLLAKYLGFNKEQLRNVKEFRDVKLFPEVDVAQADPKKAAFDVKLTNQEGGFGRVVVLVNGKEMTADARPADAKKDAATLDVKVDLTNDPRIIPGQKNKVEVVAYNAEGTLTSRGMVREFDGPGEMPKELPKPTIHAVIVGVSKYTGEKLNLRYAAKDAEDFATAMRIASGRLFPDKSNITVLTTAEGSQMPTRTNILAALEKLKSTKPGDTILVYLAGHGITYGGQDGDWYYLTSDAPSADLKDDKVRQQVTLSSAELTEILKSTPAQKQVLILDTCHSGLVVEKIAERRDVPGAQVRAVERVKDRTGMHVLAGCAADSVSYEASRYGQGLLTYSLLMGMRGAKLRQGEFVDIVDLFGYAADKVPELARDIGGVQKPTIASPRGDHFDIGQLKAEDLSKIPLQTVKPVVLRSAFQLEKPARDSLGLSKRIDDRLRESSAVARGAKFIFVDANEFPDGVLASGRYKIDSEKVRVSVSLFAGDKEIVAFTVEGVAGKPDDLAAAIVVEIEKKLAAGGAK